MIKSTWASETLVANSAGLVEQFRFLGPAVQTGLENSYPNVFGFFSFAFLPSFPIIAGMLQPITMITSDEVQMDNERKKIDF